MVSIVVFIEVDPARVDEFLVIVKAQAAAALQEPGCRRFEISQKAGQPNVFTLAELYDDDVATDAHLAAPHTARWRELTGDGLIISKNAVRGAVLNP